MSNVIEVDNICFTYGDEPVFSQIGFSVYKGDFVALIGANGTGKSTLLRLLLGELAPTAGSIRLFDRDAGRFKDWPKIAYLPQNGLSSGAGFPATVEEIVKANLFSQIGLLRFPGREHYRKTQRALEMVGMAAYSKRLIGHLSGGQQRRVMLARVLVGDPEIMLLDEPSTGVDAPTVHYLYELLRRLNQETGLTLVMVTHDIGRAAGYASRILCLEEGSLLELDKAQIQAELAHRHKHPPRSASPERSGGHGNFGI